ncbi:MAG: RagB/SusD family nutrient uptake outer membrane protein [Bacteroidales bacterium]
MKTFINKIYHLQSMKWFILSVIMVTVFNACNDEELLVQKSKSDLTDDAVLNSIAGFEYYLSGLTYQFRDEWRAGDRDYWSQFWNTDMYTWVDHVERPQRGNWAINLTPENPDCKRYWEWAYIKMIPMANKVIYFGQKESNSGIWKSEAEKNAVIAEGRFFRAWSYNILANLFGDAIIIEASTPEPKYDFFRSPRREVYELVRSDLEFAAQWLPESVDASKEGRPVRAAAQHLLTEVCISLGDYDAAIASATALINNPEYHLMTTRFGSAAGEPGDVFSDLFKEGNFNRSSGNMESILVWQIVEYALGGSGSRKVGNNFVRGFAPFLVDYVGTDGKNGWLYDVTKNPNGVDTVGGMMLGRGAGFVRPSNYALYDIWKDNWNDMRNSKYNMKREFYFNNPASTLFMQKWDPAIHAKNEKDTGRLVYSYSLKVEGPFFEGGDGSFKGRTSKDVYVMRLAETYLLRAEAYLRKGDKENAAIDINTVRARANAPAISSDEATLDYILDERARELMTEEPRVRTLIRMNNLVERVRLYDMDMVSRQSIQDYNKFWPIPQSAIDANTGSILEQNDGYQ